jgi:hypothetical protein
VINDIASCSDIPCCIESLTLIAGRKQKDALLDALSESGGRLLRIVYGKGSAGINYLKDMLGFSPEENKVLITCLLPSDKTDAVLNMLIEKFHFDKPNTGIAFTVPVERLSC